MSKNNNNQVPSADLPGLKQPVNRAILFLLALGFILMIVRQLSSDDSILPSGDSVWRVAFNSTVNISRIGTEINIAPLWNTQHVRVFGQSLFHPGLREKRLKKNPNARDIVLAANTIGVVHLEARFDLHLSQLPLSLVKQVLKEDDRQKWLIESEGIPVNTEELNQIIDQLINEDSSTTERVQAIFDYVSERVRISSNGPNDGGLALQARRGSELGASRAMVSLLRSAHLPSRIVSGIDLTVSNDQLPVYWAEAYYQNQWHIFDNVRGYFDKLPPQMIPVRRGGEHIVQIDGVKLETLKIQKTQTTAPDNLHLDTSKNIFDIFNLSRIAPAGREALALLILLPIGVLFTEFLRHFVGIRTYGTFTPTLLAMAAVYVDIATAIVIFSIVIIFGVAGRSVMPAQLSRVARLSIIFTIVATIMVFAVSTLIFFNPAVDTAIVLLPIVILTTLVDSFYSTADEKGLAVAMQRLAWTVFAAAASLLVLIQIQWGHWLLNYPEFHFFTIAVIILLGTYHKKRLSDFKVFTWIREKPGPVKKPSITEPE